MKWGVYSKLHVVLQSLEIAVLIKKHVCWKVKIRTESNRGKKCMFDCNVTKIAVRQSDYHFADRHFTTLPLCRSRQTIRSYQPGIWQAIQRTYSYWTVVLLVFKFIKSKGKLDGCARKRTIMSFFYINCKKLDASLLLASRAKKTPGICSLWSFTAESTLLRSCRTSQ